MRTGLVFIPLLLTFFSGCAADDDPEAFVLRGFHVVVEPEGPSYYYRLESVMDLADGAGEIRQAYVVRHGLVGGEESTEYLLEGSFRLVGSVTTCTCGTREVDFLPRGALPPAGIGLHVLSAEEDGRITVYNRGANETVIPVETARRAGRIVLDLPDDAVDVDSRFASGRYTFEPDRLFPVTAPGLEVFSYEALDELPSIPAWPLAWPEFVPTGDTPMPGAETDLFGTSITPAFIENEVLRQRPEAQDALRGGCTHELLMVSNVGLSEVGQGPATIVLERTDEGTYWVTAADGKTTGYDYLVRRPMLGEPELVVTGTQQGTPRGCSNMPGPAASLDLAQQAFEARGLGPAGTLWFVFYPRIAYYDGNLVYTITGNQSLSITVDSHRGWLLRADTLPEDRFPFLSTNA